MCISCGCAVHVIKVDRCDRGGPIDLPLSCAASYAASLARGVKDHDNRRPTVTPVTTSPTLVRFEDTINGRPILIEVSSVGRDRWRAQIARVPGGRTALMPFYGTTPVEAAEHLSGWLTKASRRL